MKLLRLQALNFRCFEQLDLDLNVDGLIAVVGSNGAGKSTLFEAIEWALYGGRGMLPARRYGCADNEETWVEVHFEVGDSVYAVRRIDSKDAWLTNLSQGEEICRTREATSRMVATLLGLTRDMFRGTFFARQREVQALDPDNEVKRRAQVELLLGIERLRRATAQAQASAKTQQRVVSTLEAGAPDLEALKAEAERLAREAAAGEPPERAEAALEAAKATREAHSQQLRQLRERERELLQRRARAQAAKDDAERQHGASAALGAQVADAEAAESELRDLAPQAERVEVLTAAERALDLQRADHERALALRDREHRALSQAAELADRLAALTGTDGGDADPRSLVEVVEAEIEALRPRVSEISNACTSVARETERLHARIARGEHAAELDRRLSALEGAEQAVDAALAEWHALSAQRTVQLKAIEHDIEHRDAVLAGERPAACPTCKRPYDAGELDQIVAGYERDLEAARARVTTLDAALAAGKKTGAELRARADEQLALAADRRALGEAPSQDEVKGLREQLTARAAHEVRLAEALERDERQLTELSERLLVLRGRARAAAQRDREIALLEAQRRQAENEARLFAEQLAGIDGNGYEPDAHTRVRAELAQAHAASQRCAALRGRADGLDLLRRRLDEQIQVAAAAAALVAELQAAVVEVAISPAELEAAEAAAQHAERDVEAAQAAVVEAHRRAARYAEALEATNTRLRDAHERSAQLREERVELRLQSQVAEALAAYREDASRRARPTLERETGLLLGQTTRQRYNNVQLTDSYLLEIVDAGAAHPLRRFSGGEQDLAALCLRLALSRTLARQRGAETGFILLDEVFGSQDSDRRSALLEQLHAIADSEFRQVFVVSHTDDVVEHCDLTIDVARGVDGVSRAVGPRR